MEMDRISNLPLSIIETILCRLPYHDVVRTSTLSKEWRYHWTKITKIVVIEDTENLKRSKLLCGVSQALLMHEGPIHEFTLSVGTTDWGIIREIDCIMSHLSRKKTIKKVTIDFVRRDSWGRYGSLPISLFSMSQLTDLYLNCCRLTHEPTFTRLKRRQKCKASRLPRKREKLTTTSTGLGSLTCLYVRNSWISIKTLIDLISNCPLLKTVELRSYDYDSDGATITKLFESLMVIESLTISCMIIEFLGNQGSIHEKVPIALVHLKYLCVEDIFFEWYSGLLIIALFVRSSPNLEILKLQIVDDWRGDERSWSLSLEDNADIWMEHLSELQITYLSNAKCEMDIVKFILMRSPGLKKLRIFISEIYKDTKLQISETLLSFPRASPMVEFFFENETF